MRKRRPNGETLVTPRNIVILGAVVALVGCFCPVIHLPIVGSITYMQNASGDGMWVAGISAVALVSAAFGFSAGGIICGAIIALLLFRVQGLMNEALDRMHSMAAGAGFLSGLADAMANAVYLEFGFYIVVGGGVLMLLGGIASLLMRRPVSVPSDIDAPAGVTEGSDGAVG
jgi:hypothetical protein